MAVFTSPQIHHNSGATVTKCIVKVRETLSFLSILKGVCVIFSFVTICNIKQYPQQRRGYSEHAYIYIGNNPNVAGGQVSAPHSSPRPLYARQSKETAQGSPFYFRPHTQYSGGAGKRYCTSQPTPLSLLSRWPSYMLLISSHYDNYRVNCVSRQVNMS